MTDAHREPDLERRVARRLARYGGPEAIAAALGDDACRRVFDLLHPDVRRRTVRRSR